MAQLPDWKLTSCQGILQVQEIDFLDTFVLFIKKESLQIYLALYLTLTEPIHLPNKYYDCVPRALTKQQQASNLYEYSTKNR